MHLVIAPPAAPSFSRQRMVKSGTYSSGFASGEYVIQSWSSDVSYPAVVVSDGLVVQGSGTATVTWRIQETSGATFTPRAYRNGSLVSGSFSKSGTIYTLTTTITLADGDRLEARGTGTFITIGTDSHIDVTPA